jgi:hypothetical protein
MGIFFSYLQSTPIFQQTINDVEISVKSTPIPQQAATDVEILVKPTSTFQQQFETLASLPMIRNLRIMAAIPFCLELMKCPTMGLSLSPYMNFFPSNEERTSSSSIVALLCMRLAQEPYAKSMRSVPKRASKIFDRVLAKVHMIEKEPLTVFFSFSKDRVVVPHPSLAPDVRAIMSHRGMCRKDTESESVDYHLSEFRYVFKMCARFKVEDSWLCENIPNAERRGTEATLALYSSDSEVPFDIFVIDKGKLWHVNGDKRKSITQHPVESWKGSRFSYVRFSYVQPCVAVIIDQHLVFINLVTRTTTIQIVGRDVTFHPHFPIFWTPASWNSNTRKEYPSRLWLINPSWTGAKPVAWGQNDLDRRLL